ncbi:MAG: HAD family hydrolase [Thermoplasmata archaeon]|nr:HAD family hydrolase [Thermoplasmata archaeon]
MGVAPMPDAAPTGPSRNGAARRIRFVLFDLGGTLIENRDFQGYAEVAGQLDLPEDPELWSEAVRWAETEFDRPGPPVAWVPFWTAILERVADRRLPAGTVAQFLERLERRPRAVHLFSDVRRTLERLRGQGRVLAVVSNSRSEANVRELLERAGIVAFFATVVSSGTEKVAKPDPEIFRRALARLDARAEETFYVGDLAFTDAKAAASAGLASVWLHRDGTGFGADPPEITSLTELPRTIARLERGEMELEDATREAATADESSAAMYRR